MSLMKNNSNYFIISSGSALFFEGDEASCIFEILNGVCYTSNTLIDGSRQILSFFYKGDIIGISDGAAYHCDCVAASEVKLRSYGKTTFFDTMHHSQKSFEGFMQKIAENNRKMDRHVVMLGRKSGVEKMALFLCDALDRQPSCASNKGRVQLPVRRTEIADFLGLTIETVSRCISLFKKEKLIDFNDSKDIEILNIGELRKVAKIPAD